MTNLRSLLCCLRDTAAPFVFPAGLRQLTLTIQISNPADLTAEPHSATPPHGLDAVIAAAAQLPLLESLSLAADKEARSCCLAPLVSAPALRSLELSLPEHVLESSRNIDALRHMPHLRALDCDLSPESFTRMLQPPHSMQLETLYVKWRFGAQHSAAIVHLPTLTDLTFPLCIEHTDFLPQLPNLRRLEFSTDVSTVRPEAERIMQSLHSMAGLTGLSISGGGKLPLRFTASHLVDCLPRMPLLTNLHLNGATALDSLRFLSSGPITHTLKELSLQWIRPPLPLSELVHVRALSVLSVLELDAVFEDRLDDATVRLYTPPSVLMPTLTRFVHE
jgi:hypothetical protein